MPTSTEIWHHSLVDTLEYARVFARFAILSSDAVRLAVVLPARFSRPLTLCSLCCRKSCLKRNQMAAASVGRSSAQMM